MPEVTTVMPVEVSGVRDPGMQAVILLAASLGWNVQQKINQPVVITARNGHQKRLPTNTSIRMGVFQNALSTVMAHTDEEVIATVDLIDAIVKMTKVPKDHERRLRLAVGETVAQHRERIATETGVGPRDPQAVTTRIDEVLDAHFREVLEQADPPERDPVEPVEALPGTFIAILVPADGGHHGKVAKREPFLAHKSGHPDKGTATRYVSKSSLERTWEDGYVDYECVVCGVGLKAPRSLGAHRMGHIKRGEATRAGSSGMHEKAPVLQGYVPTETHTRREPTPERVGDRYERLVDKIMDLVLPAVQARQADEVAGLQQQIIALMLDRDTYKKRYEKTRGDLQALRALIVEAGEDGD